MNGGSSRRIAFALLALAVPFACFADQGEFHTLLGGQVLLPRYKDAINRTSSTTATAGGLDVVSYYGLTNTIHVGLGVHLALARDVAFQAATVTFPDGASSSGTVYENDLAMGAGALLLYRFDTGRRLAPVLGLELGVNHHSYTQVDHVPAGAQYRIAFPSTAEFVLSARAELLLEYRFGDHLIAATGFSAIAEPGGHAPLQLAFPLRAGVAW